MASESAAVVLYDSNSVPIAVQNGVAIPASTPAIMLAGTDGANSRYILLDSSGRQIVAGAGVAGTPAGGVNSVQGVTGGTPVPVSGTVTATNPSVGTNGSAIPASSTEIGGSDGTNLQAARVYDVDTGAGTEFALGAVLRLPGSGGSVAGGTSTNPVRTDPTGTTTQPVSATSLPLPTGAATETTLAARLADTTFTGRINTLGQKTMANSTPMVIASDQSAIPVTNTSSTPARSDVTAAAVDTVLLAANASRKGCMIFNDSASPLKIIYGTTAQTAAASASNFSERIMPFTAWRADFGFTGQIRGIWGASPTGAARVTEFT